MATDHDVVVDARRIRVRSVGPLDAPTILYVHGTPDSRLTIDVLAGLPAPTPVRLVAFDRPGYGGSDFAPFTMASVARDASAVLDELGIERTAVVGQSGGGPFALAVAAELGRRITAVGVASGGGSFVSVPGAVDALDDIDRRGLSLIGVDDQAAADAFAEGFAGMAGLPAADDDDIRAAMRDLLPTDAAAMDLPGVADGLVAIMREALRQGVDGCAWDNVAWIGAWRTDLSAVTQPTWLWYGTEDPLAPVSHGVWLHEQLPHARLVVREGEGHLGIYPHWAEVVTDLTGAAG